MQSAVIRLVTCGSVDDGKSTLIGRLLAETGNVPTDILEAARVKVAGASLIPVGEVDHSLLTDGLEAEREQGITIDVAYRSMNLPNGERLIIADSPGHEQYTRNMVVAASRADVAIVVVDAIKGVRNQTVRHLRICGLMGARRVAVVINKIDGVDYSLARFQEIVAELESVIRPLGFGYHEFIPVSALRGDNVTERSAKTDWYSGKTLLDFLQESSVTVETGHDPELSVQTVIRANDFRGVAGTTVGGQFILGDEVIVLPARKRAKIGRIVTHDEDLNVAPQNRAVVLELVPDVDVTRGDLVVLANKEVPSATKFEADLVWLGDEPLQMGKSYLLVNRASSAPGSVTAIKSVSDLTVSAVDTTGAAKSPGTLVANDIATVAFETAVPVSLRTYRESRDAGGLLIVDRLTAMTVGALMVTKVLTGATNVVEQAYEINREARGKSLGQTAKTFWMTGFSGSGKSTVANAFDRTLFAQGKHAFVLDGDNVRLGLNKDLGFSREERAENVRRVAEVAKLMNDAGLVVIVALISPYADDRQLAREIIGTESFVEVYVDTPAEECARRDPKGLYAKANSGQIANFTGIHQGYEPPANPEVHLDGLKPVEELVAVLVEKLD